MTSKPELLVPRMSRQTTTTPAAATPAFCWPIRDGILHRDIESVVVHLRIVQRPLALFITKKKSDFFVCEEL